MEERVKALQAFLKSEVPENELQKITASVNTAISGFENDPSLSFAESLDKMYTKLGVVNPIKRKFWVDLLCGLTPEIENEEALREESLFYSMFRLFETRQRLCIAFGLEPLY